MSPRPAIPFALLTLLAVLAAGPGHAADRKGAFVGGGLGAGSANIASEIENFCDFFGCVSSVDDDVVVAEAHGGYRFNNYFALEGKILGAANDGEDGYDELTFAALSGRAVGLVPVGSVVDLYALVGFYTGESEVSWYDSETETGLMYGGGVQMNFGANGNFGVRVEYEFYDADELLDDFQSFTASFQYNFF